MERNKFEIRKNKILAESSSAIISTLVLGFSLNCITNLKRVDYDKCSCVLWNNSNNALIFDILIFINTIFHILTGCISGISLIYSTGIYWFATKKLSTRIKGDNNNENDVLQCNLNVIEDFDNWWDNDEKKRRKKMRTYFASILPLFFTAISFSPNIWCNNCIMGILVWLLFIVINYNIYDLSKELFKLEE